MKFVTWNCNGSLRTKYDSLEHLNADVVIVQECEDPARTTHGGYKKWASNHLWVGQNKSRGLGVFVREDIVLEPVPLDAGRLQLFLPCRINKNLLLLAVWTKHADSPNFRYIGQLWKYLQLHRATLAAGPSIVIGDLNSNSQWDEWDRWWNHSDVVRDLNQIGLVSAYHHSRNVEHGREAQPTYYMHRKLEKPYHIDYAFVPSAWLPRCDVWLGAASDWLTQSDHVPLSVSISSEPHDA